MPTLNEIALRRDEWVRMALKIGADKDLAEDLVQEMFIKLHHIENTKGLARIEYKGDINTMYLFMILRSLFIDHVRSSKKETLIPDYKNDTADSEENYINSDKEYEDLCDCMHRSKIDMYWFHGRLMDLYFLEEPEMSMRKLAEETKISLSTIFEVIKNGKETIKEKCAREWEAYKEARQT